jgi:Replication-relaxation
MTGNRPQGLVLQERDRRLLHKLGVMRVIDREQAKCVGGFGSTTRTNARLLALARARILRRFFIGTEAGGKKALYTLTAEGQRLGGAALPGLRRRDDEVLVADFFVSHQLLVNEIFCIVKYLDIPFPQVRFLRWASFREPVETGTPLIPDGYMEIAQHGKILAAFLEVDLGTEPRSVWRNKVEQYLRYARGGTFAERHGAAQFRVLVVTNSEERLKSLRTATAALAEKIFWFATFDAIRRDGFWSAVWRRPCDDRPRALLEPQP